MIYIYNIINCILFPIYYFILLWRLYKKKDNIQSIKERLCWNLTPKPEHKLIWIHAASIGEVTAAITLIQEINSNRSNIHFLVTTITIPSKQILERSSITNITHQFIPLDNIFIIRKFIKHWNPAVGIFIESEIWPCMIHASSKKFPLLLINARISERSYKRWYKARYFFKEIINNFSVIVTQSIIDTKRYHTLGAQNVHYLGNIKFSNQILDFNAQESDILQKLFINKSVIVFGSTHPEDEDVIFKVIQDLKQSNYNYYPIIIPRHPIRRNAICALCDKLQLSYSLRSKQTIAPITQDLYIIDTIGEMGLFYNIASMVFIGGSFEQGGHNILEPAWFNNLIICGPDMSNIQDITHEMLKNQAAIQIQNERELLSNIKFYLHPSNISNVKTYQNNASNFILQKTQIIQRYMSVIEKFL